MSSRLEEGKVSSHGHVDVVGGANDQVEGSLVRSKVVLLSRVGGDEASRSPVRVRISNGKEAMS